MKRIILGIILAFAASISFASGNSNNSGDANATATASHNGNTMATGGNATATGGAGGSATIQSGAVRNEIENRNTNTNINSITQGQAQGQKQGQVQGQGQGQSQSTKNSNNAKQDVTFVSPRNPASAVPGATNTTASCRNGVSAGVGGFLPIGVGGTLRDKACDLRESARLRMEMAKVAATVGDGAAYSLLMSQALALLDRADEVARTEDTPFAAASEGDKDAAFASFAQ